MDTLDTSASEESEVAPTPAPGGFDMPQPQAQAAQPGTIMIPTSEESEVASGAFGAAPTPALGGFDMPQPQAQAAQPGTGNPPRLMTIQPQDEGNSKALSSNSLKSADGLRRVEDDTKGNNGGTAGIIAAQQPGGLGNPVSPFGATPAAGGFGASPAQASGCAFSSGAAEVPARDELEILFVLGRTPYKVEYRAERSNPSPKNMLMSLSVYGRRRNRDKKR